MEGLKYSSSICRKDYVEPKNSSKEGLFIGPRPSVCMTYRGSSLYPRLVPCDVIKRLSPFFPVETCALRAYSCYYVTCSNAQRHSEWLSLPPQTHVPIAHTLCPTQPQAQTLSVLHSVKAIFAN